jgi:hypothetical protein
MDVHRDVEGLTADDVARAHAADLDKGEQYGVRYLRYWFNTDRGTVFCLVEAPDAESAVTVHREAHGLVADEIVEVKEG